MEHNGVVLTVDRGNSCDKLSVYQGVSCLRSLVAGSSLLDDALALVVSYGVSDAILSSVAAPFEDDFINALEKTLGRDVVVLSPATPLPVGVSYRSRDTLGSDRVAAAVAAAYLADGRPALMVDAGTALTIDHVSADGDFLGGSISPGVFLRLDSLHRFTSRLPLVDIGGPVPEIGYDTTTAIRSGVMRGVAAEIMAARSDESQLVFLSGGDAETIFPLLQMPEDVCRLCPDAVGLGLAVILSHVRASVTNVPL